MKIHIEQINEYNLDVIYNTIQNYTEKNNFWRKIESHKNILLKPNLLGAFKPERSVTTHPVVLEAMIKLLLDNKKNIFIGDSPGGTVPIKKVWQETGMQAISKKYNVKLLNFNQGKIVRKRAGDLEFFISEHFFNADAVINIAKYKTHSLMNYTGTVKNLYGVIPGLQKSDFHKKKPTENDFSEVLAGLYTLTREKIVLNILDGIFGMEGEGPSAGIPRNFGIFFISGKASALDYIAAKMMGFKDKQLKYIRNSLEIDTINISDIEIPDNWKDYNFENVKIKKISFFLNFVANSPEFIRKRITGLVKYYPDFNDKCVRCNICVKTCPVQVMKLEKGQLHPEIDHKNCIKCMCCHEVCPEQAIFIHRNFLAKMIIK